jgi:glycosyltransferase involved in cell wall biosynthesis
MYNGRLGQHKVSVVIPTLNEEGSISRVLAEICPISDEVIVVDGHSTDGTLENVRLFDVQILFDDKGKGSAIRKGFEHSSGDIVVMMDADEAHRRQDVQAAISKIAEGYDICMPSRFMPGGGSEDITPLRVFGNNFYKFWVRLLWGGKYTDICYGFRSFSKKAIDELTLTSDGFDIELEISIKAAKRRLRYIEIPSMERKRKYGSGKLTFWSSLILDRRILIELLSR